MECNLGWIYKVKDNGRVQTNQTVMVCAILGSGVARLFAMPGQWVGKPFPM